MHNTIYEISDKPIPKSSRATVANLPAWFFDSVSDGACEFSEDEREQEICRLSNCLGSACKWDGRKLILSPEVRQEFFKGAFQYFKNAASALAETEYAVMNVKSALTVWWAMQSVLSGGMLGLFMLGVFVKKTRPAQAAIATVLGLLTVVYISFGQRILPLPSFIHLNLAIVLGTITILLTGFILSCAFPQNKEANTNN